MALSSADINRALIQAIGSNRQDEMLCKLVFGAITADWAAETILSDLKGVSTQTQMTDLCTTILSLACEFPFFHHRLTALLLSVRNMKDGKGNTTRSSFLSRMSTLSGDQLRSGYASMFDDDLEAASIAEYINLHGFLASTLSDPSVVIPPQEQIFGFEDALFIISTSLEEHVDSHNKFNVDIPAAAQYMIHAGPAIYRACQQFMGRERATASTLWGTKGKLWEGELALSCERWEFWRSRFNSLASGKDFPTVKFAALAARRAMDGVSQASEC